MLREGVSAYFWIGLGAAIGAGVGLAFDDVGIGIALGAAAGLLVGVLARQSTS